MKKLITLLLFTSLGCGIINAQAGEPIVLSPNDTGLNSFGDASEHNGLQRSPIYIPSVFLSNHTLSFERCCIGSEIEVVQNGNVVYSTFITNEDGTVELPPYIIGECELRLRWAGFLFEGEFIIQ